MESRQYWPAGMTGNSGFQLGAILPVISFLQSSSAEKMFNDQDTEFVTRASMSQLSKNSDGNVSANFHSVP
jgi:hypothetical protein